MLRAGFDRHLVRLYRPGSWGKGRRGRRSPGGGQQKFETTPKAELYSRGVADTEDVRFLLPVDDARPKSGKCGSQAQPYTPPSYNRAPRIRNGTCTPYGAFPWTVQIQVESIPSIVVFEISATKLWVKASKTKITCLIWCAMRIVQPVNRHKKSFFKIRLKNKVQKRNVPKYFKTFSHTITTEDVQS